MNHFRDLLRYLKPFWVPTLLAPLMMVLEVIMDLMQPKMLQGIVDIGIGGHDLPFIMHRSGIMLGIAVMGLIGGVGCSVFSTIAAINFSTSVRDKLFIKLQQLSFSNLDELESGGLITRLTSDVDQVQDAVMMLLRMLIRAPLLSVGGFVMAILTAPKLSLILLAIGPLIVLLLMKVNRVAQPQFMSAQRRMDDLNTVTLENLAGVRVVKAFVRAIYESERFKKVNSRLTDAKIKSISTVITIMPAMMLLVNVGIASALWFGGVSVSHGSIKVGQLMAFINYLTQMLSSLMMASMAIIFLSRAEPSAERISEVLESEPGVKDAQQTEPLEDMQGAVSFQDVSFAYGKNGESCVLRNLSFDVKPLQTIGILGSTGEGKSTLVHLIPRLYDVSSGRVLIDNVDVKDLRQQQVRSQIAIVLQKTILFSGTVRENICYGRPDATEDEMHEAAKIAQAHGFISELAEGYDFVLEQGATNLSGGQRQRIAIARALLVRPAILILDDCTSAVDMATEAKILQGLRDWQHRCTKLIIAQRISAVMDADKILVIENGTIAASGTHRELAQTSSAYQGFLRSQMLGQGVGDVG